MKFLWISLLLSSTLFAKLQVSVAYPYIEELTKAIGKEKVSIHVLSRGDWDPHFVVPKPSLVGKLSQSDLLILNGASLEEGWLPPLIKRANNANIQEGAKGYIALSQYIKLRDIPKSTSRSMGHVHKEGNPHFILDPHTVLSVAEVVMLALSAHDKSNQKFYNANYKAFKAKWQTVLSQLDKQMKRCAGIKVVQYHELYNYFLARYNIRSIDNLEPIPGIKPNAKHTQKLINEIKDEGIKYILQDVYHEHKTAEFIASKSGAKVLRLPHDVGALKGTSTLKAFYKTLADGLCKQ